MFHQGLHPRVRHLGAAHQAHRLEARAAPHQGLYPRVRHLGAARQIHQSEAVELGHHYDDLGVRHLFWEDQNRLAGVHSLLDALVDLRRRAKSVN